MMKNIDLGQSIARYRLGFLAVFLATFMALGFTTSVYAVIDPGSAATAQNTAAGSTQLTINKPATTNTGDLLLAQITFHTPVTATIVPPTGWTQVLRTDNTTELGQAIFRKIAGPSEPSSYTWNFSSGITRAAGGIANYRGVDQANPIGNTSGNFDQGDTLTALSIEAADDSRMVLHLGVKESTTITTPAGLTFRFLQRQPTSGNLTVRAEDQSRNAGPTGNKVSTAAVSDFWIAQQVILLTDVTSPTVVITSTASEPTANSPIPVNVQFSEPVNGFAAEDVVVTNGTVGNFVGEFTDHYTFDVTPSAQGLVTVNIPAGVAEDSTGNANSAAEPLSRTFNSESPTVVISSTSSNPTSVSPIPVTVQFSENVTGFVTGDITVTNGTLGNFVAVDAKTYTLDVTPTAPGEVTLKIGPGVAQDGDANPNSESALFSRIFTLADTTAPTVVISSTTTNPTSESPIPVTVQFSENVTGFEAGDIVVTNGAVSSFTQVDGDTYIFNLTPAAPGDVTVNIAAGVAQDEEGNPNTAAAPFLRTFVVADTTAPAVTINQAVGQADPTSGTTVNFTVVFNEPVSGFTGADVTLSGTAGATTATVTQVAPNNGTTYNVAVTGMSTGGTVIASIAAGVASDSDGNGNQASTSTDNTVTFTVDPGEQDFELALPFVKRSEP